MKTTTTGKKKIKKRIIIALSIVIALIIAALLFFWLVILGGASFERLTNDRTLPDNFTSEAHQSGFAADGLHLVKAIEEMHSIFVVEGLLPDDYEAAREEFLTYVQNEDISKEDFYWAAKKFVVCLQDGHMSLGPLLYEWTDQVDEQTRKEAFGNALVLLKQLEEGNLVSVMSDDRYLDISWIVRDGQLFLLNENGSLAEEVIEIGGIPTSEVFSAIDTYFFYENESARKAVYSNLSRSELLLDKAGVEIAADDAVMLTLRNGQNKPVSIVEMEPESEPSEDYLIRHEMMDDIFFIDLRAFVPDDKITETADVVKQAVANGTRKFILDLRGNGGGSDQVGIELLEAMGITPPDGGGIIRISDPWLDQTEKAMPIYRLLRIPHFFGANIMYIKPDISNVKNPNNVFVSVLTDARTFSAATTMATGVQDGNLGNIIGEPSANMPNYAGDERAALLPYSGIVALISTNYNIRPDVNADPFTLKPDIMVDPTDALDAALEHLRNLP